MLVQFLVIQHGLPIEVGELVVPKEGITALQEAGGKHFREKGTRYEERYGKGVSFQARWLDFPSRRILKTAWINV